MYSQIRLLKCEMFDYSIRKTESDNKLTVVLGYFQWNPCIILTAY